MTRAGKLRAEAWRTIGAAGRCISETPRPDSLLRRVSGQIGWPVTKSPSQIFPPLAEDSPRLAVRARFLAMGEVQLAADQCKQGGGADERVGVAADKVPEEGAHDHVLGQHRHRHVQEDDAGDHHFRRRAEPARRRSAGNQGQ